MDPVNFESPCILWDGPASPQGYPRVSYAVHKHQNGHVVVAKMNGIFEEGKCVLHRCNNKLCINPEHLYAGTNSDNMRDRCMIGHQNTSHLTPEDILAIRASKESRKELAKKYSVSYSAIKKIKLRYTWKWI